MTNPSVQLENLYYKDKSFDALLVLILQQANCDYTISDDIYYIIEIQKKDVIKKFKQTKVIRIENLKTDDITSILPQDLNSSGFMKIDKNTNSVILTGSNDEIKLDSNCSTSYVYGSDGQRSNKYTYNSETIYFNKMWTLRTDSGISSSGGQTSKNIYLGDTRIVTKLNSGNDGTYSEELHKQYYYHSDHLGSASLISDREGYEYQRLEYTPYGELWVEKTSNTGSEYLPYKFTGKEMDSETGLYYYGARYLDPKYSRWISTDPALGEYIPQALTNDDAKKHNQSLPGQGGVFNTINCDLYHYAGNNPVKYVDPDGRQVAVPYLPVVIPPIYSINENAASSDHNLINIDLAKKDNLLNYTPKDKEGNPIPPGNEPQSPLGKGANAGPEDIPDISKFGEPGNIPPSPKKGHDPKFLAAIILASIGLCYDNESEHIDTLIGAFVRLFKNNEKTKETNIDDHLIKNQEIDVDAISGAAPTIEE